ncbi:SAM-dependent methyltransferase [Verrucomicrobiaceae bacterium N1E253]|uniref:SAM-dependent methyltransferase n=1 Tax=Oceaniferula marina TaxID=2748318 RepID=A0A851GIS2_9BACT|nr:class I SAM-dependent methyltransferase [Oceaniferula marina]NWK57079.1 SAM-dependent methyltransferase [Oceaniferula marina]
MKELTVEGSLIHWGHAFLQERVTPGSSVVDATLGNGHDALFLAGLVGAGGRLFGFDIQTAAIGKSRQRLEDGGISAASYQLFCCGHERMLDQIGERFLGKIQAVMFNLGYLPGADKQVITHGDSSLMAMDQALRLLGSGGVLSVMCYPGHSGGDTEAAQVLSWVLEREASFVECCCIRRAKASKRSPFLLLIVMP